MKKLIILFCITVSASLYAQTSIGENLRLSAVGGGGNGQLVVIPSRHKKPVPYELAKSYDSGVYRNFFKLPGINGNLERRARFNKNYAAHALKWLDKIKVYAPTIYADLMKAAKKTRFRYLENYILWEHQPYPAGEVDYKTYEKAAYYNGEIIVSTIVMDRLGGIENYITKEMSQGFVMVHELINAAYPELSVATKLKLGEIIGNIELLGWDKLDFAEEFKVFCAEAISSDSGFVFLKSLSSEEKMAVFEMMIDLKKEASTSFWKSLKEKSHYYEQPFRRLTSFAPLYRKLQDKMRTLSEEDALSEMFESFNYDILEFEIFYATLKVLDMTKVDLTNKDTFKKIVDPIALRIKWGLPRGDELHLLENVTQTYLREKRVGIIKQTIKVLKGMISNLSLERTQDLSFLMHLKLMSQSYEKKDEFKSSFKSYILKHTNYAHFYVLSYFELQKTVKLSEAKINFDNIHQEMQIEINKVKAKNNILNFYYAGNESQKNSMYLHYQDYGNVLSLERGYKFKLLENIKEKKGMCSLIGSLSFEETYKFVKHKNNNTIVLKVINSPDRKRVGAKIKIDYEEYYSVRGCSAIRFK